jgi:uncharacterized protein YkwD
VTLRGAFRSDQLMSTLAGATVAVVLGSLVLASYAIAPQPRIARATDTTATVALAVERMSVVARGGRVREEPPSIFGLAPADPEPDVLMVLAPRVTPEPTPEPTAEPTPRPTPRPTAQPRTPPPAPALVVTADTAAAEQHMLALMNASRAAGGLRPLVMDARVAAAARQHSLVESQYGYVYHDGPDGTARSRYVPVCGNGWYGENTGKIWQWNLERLHNEFMNEPWQPINHRTNIMDPNFTRVGVGAVVGRDALYMTMAFCR